jgi:hypothetical protein
MSIASLPTVSDDSRRVSTSTPPGPNDETAQPGSWPIWAQLGFPVAIARDFSARTQPIAPTAPKKGFLAVINNNAIAVRHEEQRLGFPVIGAEGPTVVEHDQLAPAAAPVRQARSPSY